MFKRIYASIALKYSDSSTDDLSFGLLLEKGIHKALQQRDFDVFEQIMSDLSAHDLSLAVEGLAHSEELNAPLRSFIDHPNSELARLLGGRVNIITAWEKRTGTVAEEVGEDQWLGFQHYLNLAEECLDYKWTKSSYQLLALSDRITVCRGFSDKDLAKSLLQESMKLDNEFVPSLMSYFKVISPKWLGCEEELLRFCTESAVPVRPLLQAMFLAEVFSDLYFDNTETAKVKFKRAYLGQYREWSEQWDLQFRNTVTQIYFYNYSILLAHVLGFKKEEKVGISKLRGYYTQAPWGYFGMENKKQVELFLKGRFL